MMEEVKSVELGVVLRPGVVLGVVLRIGVVLGVVLRLSVVLGVVLSVVLGVVLTVVRICMCVYCSVLGWAVRWWQDLKISSQAGLETEVIGRTEGRGLSGHHTPSRLSCIQSYHTTTPSTTRTNSMTRNMINTLSKNRDWGVVETDEIIHWETLEQEDSIFSSNWNCKAWLPEYVRQWHPSSPSSPSSPGLRSTVSISPESLLCWELRFLHLVPVSCRAGQVIEPSGAQTAANGGEHCHHHQPSLCILISEAVRPADDDVVSSTWRKCLHLAERMAEIPANSRQKGGL